VGLAQALRRLLEDISDKYFLEVDQRRSILSLNLDSTFKDLNVVMAFQLRQQFLLRISSLINLDLLGASEYQLEAMLAFQLHLLQQY